MLTCLGLIAIFSKISVAVKDWAAKISAEVSVSERENLEAEMLLKRAAERFFESVTYLTILPLQLNSSGLSGERDG